jgi:hypothetical protein
VRESKDLKSLKLNERILCAIKGFLIEHTMMPVSFNFGGSDILYSLRNPLHKSGVDLPGEEKTTNPGFDSLEVFAFGER